MPNYLRALQPGGTFFLTLVTQRRVPIFADEGARAMLHDAFAQCRRHHGFVLDAMVLLPDHLHLLMTLPEDDADFSMRIANIKSHFTRHYLASGGAEQSRSVSRLRQRVRGVWQRRFWEHTIRDSTDLHRHFDYIHYNPVKHKSHRPQTTLISPQTRWPTRSLLGEETTSPTNSCPSTPRKFM